MYGMHATGGTTHCRGCENEAADVVHVRMCDQVASTKGREQTRTRTCGTHTTHLLGVEVLRSVRILFEEFATPVPKQLMIGDLDLECPRIPRVVELGIVRMDECQFLICSTR